MSKCNFSIPFAITPAELVDKTRNAIEKNGGTFNGDETAGNFEVKVMGTIAGSYAITGNEINIIIDSKPLFIGCGQLEGFMRNSFGG